MIVLGSTGSIGVNALKIAKEHNLKINALACGKNYELLKKQIELFKPKYVYIDKAYKSFMPKDVVVVDDVCDLLEIDDDTDDDGSNLVINAIVGFAGLKSSIKTQEVGKTLALANKESLVVGGFLLDCSKIRPIDSEHSGLSFLLKGHKKEDIKRLVITASGGAFYEKSIDEIKKLSSKDALKHPNWSMGAKITIDSATMANKLFECIEAYYLYGIKKIDALVERKSKIHALVEFVDGSTTLNLSGTDMKLSIASAIFKDLKPVMENEDLFTLEIGFKKIDEQKYPIFSLKDTLLNNPKLGVIINAANEVYNQKYLNNECGFYDISDAIFKALDKFRLFSVNSFEEVLELDKKVRLWLN